MVIYLLENWGYLLIIYCGISFLVLYAIDRGESRVKVQRVCIPTPSDEAFFLFAFKICLLHQLGVASLYLIS